MNELNSQGNQSVGEEGRQMFCDHSFTPNEALEYFMGNLVISVIGRDKG